ncbi:hypothetical protein BDN71DRAFT_1459005 [Pleurotus eryngii]|uniref:Uncharacterized protein n=1 Tax=Pleurotus eryngii TaxID=5323 RepID=A0A9P5ZID8_PLEER|nr:hypothetical protein BDN71DRAFT_1459005 [Pleurotus eryngii]
MSRRADAALRATLLAAIGGLVLLVLCFSHPSPHLFPRSSSRCLMPLPSTVSFQSFRLWSLAWSDWVLRVYAVRLMGGTTQSDALR